MFGTGLGRRGRGFRRLGPWLAIYVTFSVAVVVAVILAATHYRDLLMSYVDEAGGSGLETGSGRPGAPPGSRAGTANTSDVQKLADDFAETAESVDGDLAAISRGAAQMLRSFQEAQRDFDQAARRVNEAGWGQVSGLDSVEAIDARIGLIEVLARENERFAATLRELPQIFRKDLQEQGVSERQIAAALGRHMPESKTKLVLRIRELDGELCAARLGALRLLRERWGGWKHDAQSDDVVFADLKAGERHRALLAKAREVLKRQQAVQAQLRGG